MNSHLGQDDPEINYTKRLKIQQHKNYTKHKRKHINIQKVHCICGTKANNKDHCMRNTLKVHVELIKVPIV